MEENDAEIGFSKRYKLFPPKVKTDKRILYCYVNNNEKEERGKKMKRAVSSS